MILDILAFGAHPDDVELFAGGTLAKMAALGHATGVVDMTRGELGTRGTPALRKQEARKAAEVLGLKIRENLGLADGDVAVTSEARLKVIRMLRKYCPRIVLTHHWDDKHPDHVNTSRLVAEAVHHSGLAKIKTGQARYRPPTLLFFKLPPECPSKLCRRYYGIHRSTQCRHRILPIAAVRSCKPRTFHQAEPPGFPDSRGKHPFLSTALSSER